MTYTLLANLSGYSIPRTIVATSNALYLRFGTKVVSNKRLPQGKFAFRVIISEATGNKY